MIKDMIQKAAAVSAMFVFAWFCLGSQVVHAEPASEYQSAYTKGTLDRNAFVHPGIINNAQELAWMKQYATGNGAKEPWKSAFPELKALVQSYYDRSSGQYIDFSKMGTTQITRANSGGFNDMRINASKAYNLSVYYHITGDETYAKTARDIMMHYSNQFEGIGSLKDGGLYDCTVISGVIAQKFCSAAEILIYDKYSGWGNKETKALIDMFNKDSGADVICSMARLLDWRNDVDGLMSKYDMDNLAHGHAAFTDFGALSYAVFAGDKNLYEKTVKSITASVSPDHTEGGASWQRKPKVKGTGGSLTYIINPVTGQNKESDRDMVHAIVLTSSLVTSAKIADNQGDNSIFESHDRLLLKNVEFMAKYNLGYDVSYTNTYPWEHHTKAITTFNRGYGLLEDPMFEAAYNYYRYNNSGAQGNDTYLEQLVNNRTILPEPISEDVTGMGTLLYSNPARTEVYHRLPEKKKNPKNTILADQVFALVSNTSVKGDGRVAVKGKKGIISYPTPDWQQDGKATKEIGIKYSSTTKGYVEIRLQSVDGTRYGQYLTSDIEAGNTGSLLARIDLQNTNGVQAEAKGLIFNKNGNTGGELVNNGNKHMLFVVFYPENPNGQMEYSQLLLRP